MAAGRQLSAASLARRKGNSASACLDLYRTRTRSEATVTNQGLHGFGKQVLEDVPSIEATITDPPEWIMTGLPKVQTQHGPYCVFYAIAYVVELRTGAVIDIPAYVDGYIMKLRKFGHYAEIKKGMTDLEVFQNENGLDRVVKALEMLKNEGVMAEKNHVKLRVAISGYTCHERMNYDEVCDMLYYGDPILGTFDIGGNFNENTGGIYETIVGSHMVMFVGYGSKNKRQYLVFLNSYGIEWGTNGLGRIYFDQVHQKEQYEAFRFITLQFREVDTHLAKFCPNLHVPTSELTHQSDGKPAPPFEISDPSQAYGYGNSEIRLQESAARYNEIGKSSKAHQSMEEMKPSLLAGTMELEASKEKLWRIEQSIPKLVPQVVADPWYNELTKPSKEYQVSGTSKMHVIGKGFHGYVYPSSDIQDMIDSRAFTAETVIHNMSELCVGKDVRADKLENLERIGHGGSIKDDLKEIQENQWKLFWVSDFGKERALMDQIDPAQ